ncbi:MAG: hypothetical protein KKC99_09540 [Proteobacteria bacterium]|nr:hypothetical protein [Pseudomonadota bacterium]
MALKKVVPYLKTVAQEWDLRKDNYDFSKTTQGPQSFLNKEEIGLWVKRVLEKAEALEEMETSEEAARAMNYALHFHAFNARESMKSADSSDINGLKVFLEHWAYVDHLLIECERKMMEDEESIAAVTAGFRSSVASIMGEIAKERETILEKIEQEGRSISDTHEIVGDLVDKARIAVADLERVSLTGDFATSAKWHGRFKWGWLGGFVVVLGAIGCVLFIDELVGDYGLDVSGYLKDITPKEEGLNIFLQAFIFRFIGRLPFVFPLVWLTWFCAVQFGNSMRLHESYSFKHKLLSFFEKYKAKVEKIDQGKPDSHATEVLTSCFLAVMSEDPIRSLGKPSKEVSVFQNAMERLACRVSSFPTTGSDPR